MRVCLKPAAMMHQPVMMYITVIRLAVKHCAGQLVRLPLSTHAGQHQIT